MGNTSKIDELNKTNPAIANCGKEATDEINKKGAQVKSEMKDLGQELEGTKDNVKSFVGSKAKTALESAGVDNWGDVKEVANQAVAKGREIANDVAGQVKDGATAAVEQMSSTVK